MSICRGGNLRWKKKNASTSPLHKKKARILLHWIAKAQYGHIDHVVGADVDADDVDDTTMVEGNSDNDDISIAATMMMIMTIMMVMMMMTMKARLGKGLVTSVVPSPN